MPQFLISSKNIENDIVKIIDNEYRHIKTVLRKKIGDSLQLFDENNQQYTAVIIDITNTEIFARIVEYKQKQELLDTTLYQCIPKLQKFDFIVEKATELGVKKIIPIISKYVVVKLDDKSINHKLSRWQKIAEAAAKQSGSPIIPIIESPLKFAEAIKTSSKDSLKLIAWEHGTKHLKEVITKTKSVSIFIGAEGGLANEEISLAKEYNWQTFRLKGNILRAETAPISIISIINYELGFM